MHPDIVLWKRNVTDRTAAARSPHAITVNTSILVPCCAANAQCKRSCRKLCEDFDRAHVQIDSLNTGIPDLSDFFSRYPSLSPSNGPSEQKPFIIYSVRINADQNNGGIVKKVPIFDLPAPNADLLRSVTPKNWSPKPSHERTDIVMHAEMHAQDMIIESAFWDRRPLICPECNNLARFLHGIQGTHTEVCVPHESIFVSRNISIPVCSVKDESPCRLRVEQRMEHWQCTQHGERAANKCQRFCSECNAEESVALRHKRCQECRVTYYCSRDRQLKHRKKHKRACRKWLYDTNPNSTDG